MKTIQLNFFRFSFSTKLVGGAKCELLLGCVLSKDCVIAMNIVHVQRDLIVVHVAVNPI